MGRRRWVSGHLRPPNRYIVTAARTGINQGRALAPAPQHWPLARPFSWPLPPLSPPFRSFSGGGKFPLTRPTTLIASPSRDLHFEITYNHCTQRQFWCFLAIFWPTNNQTSSVVTTSTLPILPYVDRNWRQHLPRYCRHFPVTSTPYPVKPTYPHSRPLAQPSACLPMSVLVST